ncbi:unannotated protein [freshwater metagenome]|uniref:Unannotated protein n=1 Tax=freshwater metagenome TaxID=449393 RepID=A0A6J6MN29_9ZZZZ
MHSRFHHCSCSESAVLFIQRRIKRPTINADSNCKISISRFRCNSFDVFWFTNVARVQTKSVNTCFHCSQRHLVLMVNIGDDRNRRTRNNLRKTFCCILVITCAPNNVAACCCQCVDLLQRAFDIGGLRSGHGLHRDGSTTTDRNFAHHDLLSIATLEHVLQSVSSATN